MNKKEYTYTKIAFTSRSPALIQSVKETLINFGINARISKDGCDVRIDGQKDVEKYLKTVGTHNFGRLKMITNGGLRRMVRQRFAKPWGL